MLMADVPLQVQGAPQHDHGRQHSSYTRVNRANDEIRGECRRVPARLKGHREVPGDDGMDRHENRQHEGRHQLASRLLEAPLARRTTKTQRQAGIHPLA